MGFTPGMAVDYLCNHGHRDIGYISFAFENQTTMRKRYQGFLESIKKNNIKLNKDWIIVDDSVSNLESLETTKRVFNKLVNKKQLPSAFATATDLIAFSLVSTLNELV